MLKSRVLACLLTLSAIAAAPAAISQTAPDYAAIVAAPDRSDADRKLDTNRAPAKWLAFIGAKPGMKILDIEAVYGCRSAGRQSLCAKFGSGLCARQGSARCAAQDPSSRQYRLGGAAIR
jgi:hypothetical protein